MNEGLLAGLTGTFSKAGLAAGSTAGTIKTAAPNGAGTDYAIDGLAYHYADTDNITLTANAQQADLTSCLYLVQVDADGNISLKKGTERTTADLGDNLALQWPWPDDANVPLGGFRIDCDGATFTSGTTSLGASGITATYYDFIGQLPRKALS